VRRAYARAINKVKDFDYLLLILILSLAIGCVRTSCVFTILTRFNSEYVSWDDKVLKKLT
jgi:hypothetical protein